MDRSGGEPGKAQKPTQAAGEPQGESVHFSAKASDKYEPTFLQTLSEVPNATWIAGGAALLVLALALRLVLGGEEATEPTQSPLPVTSTAASAPPKPTVNARDLAPLSPLNLEKRLSLARARAAIWNPSAKISRFRILLENAAPSSPLVIEFGVPKGPAVPGNQLHPQRLIVTVDGDQVTEQETRSDRGEKMLEEPNCPFDAAYRAILGAVIAKETRTSAEYVYSERHGRPTYLFETADGRVQAVDADQCQLILRK